MRGDPSIKVDALERGQWGVAALWLIEPFGGHIVTYTRALQLANYVLADYSPDFVRLSGIAALALAFVSVAWLGFRVLGRTLPAALIFTLGAWLIASPTIYVLLAWPDSLVPYYGAHRRVYSVPSRRRSVRQRGFAGSEGRLGSLLLCRDCDRKRSWLERARRHTSALRVKCRPC